MIRFLSVSLGFAAPAVAMLLVACLSWNDGRKERRRTLALRQWLREQLPAGSAPIHSRAISSSKLLSALRNWSGENTS